MTNILTASGVTSGQENSSIQKNLSNQVLDNSNQDVTSAQVPEILEQKIASNEGNSLTQVSENSEKQCTFEEFLDKYISNEYVLEGLFDGENKRLDEKGREERLEKLKQASEKQRELMEGNQKELTEKEKINRQQTKAIIDFYNKVLGVMFNNLNSREKLEGVGQDIFDFDLGEESKKLIALREPKEIKEAVLPIIRKAYDFEKSKNGTLNDLSEEYRWLQQKLSCMKGDLGHLQQNFGYALKALKVVNEDYGKLGEIISKNSNRGEEKKDLNMAFQQLGDRLKNLNEQIKDSSSCLSESLEGEDEESESEEAQSLELSKALKALKDSKVVDCVVYTDGSSEGLKDDLKSGMLAEKSSNFLKKVLGESNPNLEKMKKVVEALFLKNDFKNDLVEIKSATIAGEEIESGKCLCDGWVELFCNSNELEDVNNSKFALKIEILDRKQRLFDTLAHELGHVLQEMNWELNNFKNKVERCENNCGEELISLYFEQLAYLLNRVDEKDFYNMAKARWIQFWQEAVALRRYFKFCDENYLDFYGVSFVVAINRAVEFNKNQRSKTDIINELLDLTNNDKLDLKNLDFNFLNEELNQFETSFREYLDILNKKLENDAKSISKNQTKLAGDNSSALGNDETNKINKGNVGIMGRIKALAVNLIASVKSYFACSCVNRC